MTLNGGKRLRPVVCALLVLCGCGGGGSGSGTPPTITVHPGESIQVAIDTAPANAVIVVEPGIYHESPTQPTAVTISKDGIQLIGRSTPENPVVLENAGNQKNGIWVSPTDSVGLPSTYQGEHPPCGENGSTVRRFLLQGFTVRGFAQYGVYLACADGFTLTQNVADANQVYGLFPVHSLNGTMSDNEARNTSLDVALYVGQSDHVTVSGNRAHDSIQGLEIENCSDVTVTNNDVFNNTAGILVDIAPGLQKTDQTNVLIADNTVHDNNRPLVRPAPPRGSGITVLGGSQVTVRHNTVSNNGFVGIMMTSLCSSLWTQEEECTNLDIDPHPSNNRILDNQLSGNGASPPNDPLLAQVAADLVWDGTGTANCWSGNTPSATLGILGGEQNLPACP